MRERMRIIKSRYSAGVLAVIGYLLSPLSWWNDLLVNMPLAYLFAFPFSLIDEHLYLPAFILGYWLSNLLGLVMMHHAGTTLIKGHSEIVSWRKYFLITLAYTILIVALVMLGLLPSVSEFMKS